MSSMGGWVGGWVGYLEGAGFGDDLSFVPFCASKEEGLHLDRGGGVGVAHGRVVFGGPGEKALEGCFLIFFCLHLDCFGEGGWVGGWVGGLGRGRGGGLNEVLDFMSGWVGGWVSSSSSSSFLLLLSSSSSSSSFSSCLRQGSLLHPLECRPFPFQSARYVVGGWVGG